MVRVDQSVPEMAWDFRNTCWPIIGNESSRAKDEGLMHTCERFMVVFDGLKIMERGPEPNDGSYLKAIHRDCIGSPPVDRQDTVWASV